MTEIFNESTNSGRGAKINYHISYSDESCYPTVRVARDWESYSGEGVYMYKFVFINKKVQFTEIHTGAYIEQLLNLRETEGTSKSLAKKLFYGLQTANLNDFWNLMKNFDEKHSLSNEIVHMLQKPAEKIELTSAKKPRKIKINSRKIAGK